MIALLIEQGIALLQEYPFLAVFALFLAGMLVYYQLVVIKPVVLNVKPNSRYEVLLLLHDILLIKWNQIRHYVKNNLFYSKRQEQSAKLQDSL